MDLISRIVSLKTQRDIDLLSNPPIQNNVIENIEKSEITKFENSEVLKFENSNSQISENFEIVKSENQNSNTTSFNKIWNTDKPIPLCLVSKKNLPPETTPPLDGKYIDSLEMLMEDIEIIKVVSMMCPTKRRNLFKKELEMMNSTNFQTQITNLQISNPNFPKSEIPNSSDSINLQIPNSKISNSTNSDSQNSQIPIQKSKIIIRPEITQDWAMLDVAIKACPFGWENVFYDALPELIELNNILVTKELNKETFFPLKKDLFRAFDMCSLSEVKVVIIGQDPYYSYDTNGLPVAQGAAFSVGYNTEIPSSLKNIFTEVNKATGCETPSHGNLSSWMRQGVLLLNTCLTVKPGEPGSHYKKGNIWIGFLGKILKAICLTNPRCIYMLWGREVQKIETMLTGKPNILKAPHPSGLSAHRGFFGCDHFREANKILLEQGKKIIDWRII